MHPACWDIFLQEHARLVTRKPLDPDLGKLGDVFSSQELEQESRGLIPDWSDNYGGPEQFWDDGWAWSEDPEASNVVGLLEASPEFDYLVRDPTVPKGFDNLLANPPRSSATMSRILIKPGVAGEDTFVHLPEELLLQIICFLPTATVQAVRLASRRMANVQLSTRYWRSRFEFPNELCHINLPPNFSGDIQGDGQAMDWHKLCDALLHPTGEEFQWWQNRKRITSLNRKLIFRLLE